MCKITIISCVYNTGELLRRSLDSFISQTYKDLEIIMVNNASTDNSQNIINEYINKDSRVKVIKNDENLGPSAGYAMGIDNVTTEYFTLCDADDYIDLNYIEVLYNYLTLESADVAMCCNDMVWPDGSIKILRRPNHSKIVFRKEDIPKLLPQIIDHQSDFYLGYYLSEIGMVCGKLYRTSVVKDNKINYNKNLWIWCDWLFNFQVVKRINKLVYTEDTSYHYYQSVQSATRSSKMKWKQKDQIKLALDNFEIECKDTNNEKLKRALSFFYLHNLMIIRNSYIRHYPKETTIKDIKLACKEIQKWSQAEFLYKNKNSKYFTFKHKVQVFVVKRCIVFPQIIIRRILNIFRQ